MISFAELGSDPELAGRGSGRMIFPSGPSVSALESAFASKSRNCLVASFGSEALHTDQILYPTRGQGINLLISPRATNAKSVAKYKRFSRVPAENAR